MSKKKPIDPIFHDLFEVAPRKGDFRKLEILKTAISCIARKGIEKTNYETIGQMLGIRRSHVAYYFGSKEELVLKTIEYISAAAQSFVVGRIEGADSARARMVAYIEANFDWAIEFPDHSAVLLLFYYYCRTDAEFRTIYTDIRATGAQRLEALLLDYVRTRKTGAALPQGAAKAVQNLITGALLDGLVTEGKGLKPELERRKAETLSAILRILG